MTRSLSVFLLCSLIAMHAVAGTTGSIRGVIKDKDKKEALGGVTVIARSPALQGEQVALSDEQGLYVITDLPPGVYTVSAMFADAVAERNGVEVSVDKTVGINLDISLTAGAGEVYTIEEKAPNVDVATSTVGRTLSKEYIAHVPHGRSQDFGELLDSSPSSGGGGVAGATYVENNYVIDGLNATGMSFGTLNAPLPLDFVEQFEIKEGGYGPEFGRATGGFVNVVTKGGSNEFHGSVFGIYRPDAFLLPSKSVEPVGSIVTNTGLDYYLTGGFEVGGPIVKDLLWFHVGYAPELQKRYTDRTFRWFADTNGVLQLTNLGEAIYTDNGQLLDANGNRVQAALSDRPVHTFQHLHQYTFKLTHLINNNNRHSINVRGAPSFFISEGASRSDPSTNTFTQNLNGNLWSTVYNFNGKYFNDQLKLDVYLGAHHEETHTTPFGPKSEDALIIWSNPESLRDIADLSQMTLPVACQAQNDILDPAGNRISRCQVNGWNRFGNGGIDDTDQTRFAEKIALTNLFQFAGLHQFKYGIDFEQILSKRFRSTSGQRGGELIYTAFGPNEGGYYQGQGFALDRKLIPNLSARTASFNYGVFAGDSWSPVPTLVLNYGLRWEGQTLYGVQDVAHRDTLAPKFSILTNFSPRAGAVWDFTKEGKGALRFNYGRYYESIPLDIMDRGFGGESLMIDARARTGCRPSGFNDDGSPKDPNEQPFASPYQVTNPYLQCRRLEQNFLGGSDSLVMPGLKGQYSDEFIVSADYEPVSSWVFGITGVYRYLGRVIEDLSTDGASTYLIANPGDFDSSQIDEIRERIAQTSDPKELARLKSILATAPSINTFPKATRHNWQIQFKVDKKLSHHFLMNASYVLSWTKGNYPGLFDATTGQLDPNASGQFDLPQLVMNKEGYLPQDTRHIIKVGGYYRAAFKDFGVAVPLVINLGINANAQSGTPLEVVGTDPLYGARAVSILPRGTGGRLPWVWQIDATVGVEWGFSDDISLEVFTNLFNITNNQQITGIDDTYTFSNVRPIVGGERVQLADLRSTDGTPVTVNQNYGNATSYQPAFAAQLGARLRF